MFPLSMQTLFNKGPKCMTEAMIFMSTKKKMCITRTKVMYRYL